ncbi:hypothetical protein YTPLAS18_25070 [Nitrospira sp.]|nr:hypothetical protein YTPLAS18_25070 [Nitrospira sp.]
MILRWLISCIVFVAVLHAVSSSGANSGRPAVSPLRPFAAGERLTYELSWMGITAGTAVMGVEAAEPVDHHPLLKLLTTANSSPFVTRFYPVHNRVESWIDADTLVPQRMSFQRREGKRKNDFQYVFRQAEGKVTAVKDGQAAEIDIATGTQDTISCLYFARSNVLLIPGTSTFLNVHHDKKNYTLEVRVEGIEQLEGRWGRQEAVRLLVVMPFQGIFLNEGNVRVWLSNDARRVPLLMKAKVIIGSVVAKLVDGYGSGPTS